MSTEEKIESKETNTSQYGIQDVMSIGYVFLLILGVLNQTIYYGILGINIFEYTTVLDVLISPIAVLSDSWIILVTVIGLVILMIGYFKLIRMFYDRLAKKEKYQKGKKKEKLDKVRASFNKKYAVIPFILFVMMSMYVGLGVGSGQKIKERINNFDYKYTDVIVFEDGEKLNTKIVGKNSSYVFYVTKEEANINIVPIEGNIKLIKKIKKEKK
ncbi:conserved membrane hypothetical protein [Tenacibaculum sp. 190524A05c]|uniref:hypothetical protein n=1 Tax=Tenacibaculum platacis TaxID=3137852 RepID=UPI0031FA565D